MQNYKPRVAFALALFIPVVLGSAAKAQTKFDLKCHPFQNLEPYEAVKAAGYLPGLYVGGGALLSGEQLYSLPFEHYWRSQSRVPDIPNRGYQLIQLFPSIKINASMSISFKLTTTAGSRNGFGSTRGHRSGR